MGCGASTISAEPTPAGAGDKKAAPGSHAGAGTKAVAPSSIAELQSHNKAFAADEVYRAQRDSLKDAQHPKFCIVSCSDSRVPPEVIFGARALGSMFVIRTAGHVIDEGAFESIMYCNSKISPHISNIIVLGHEKCGGVHAAWDSFHDPAIRLAFPSITGWLHKIIRHAKDRNKDVKEEDKMLSICAKLSAQHTAHWIKNKLHASGSPDVNVISGVYDVDTGLVSWHEPPAVEKGWDATKLGTLAAP